MGVMTEGQKRAQKVKMKKKKSKKTGKKANLIDYPVEGGTGKVKTEKKKKPKHKRS